jgi:hypothetical protein
MKRDEPDWEERIMPVKISSVAPMSDEEFEALRRQKRRSTNPAMDELLREVAAGRAMRVPLEEGQSARGLRAAISRSASSRGLKVETIEGEGFIAVKKTDESRSGRARSGSAEAGQRRRGRPPKQREADDGAS